MIKINPTTYSSVPERPETIFDRRNQMEGNISLFQQLDHLELLNDMLLDDAFRPEYLARFDIKAPIHIPKSFKTDPDRPYYTYRGSKCLTKCRRRWTTKARSTAVRKTSTG